MQRKPNIFREKRGKYKLLLHFQDAIGGNAINFFYRPQERVIGRTTITQCSEKHVLAGRKPRNFVLLSKANTVRLPHFDFK